MKYISTRGGMEPIEFMDAVMCGLAPDGGLVLPERLPDVRHKLGTWKDLSYQDLALEVFSLFATDIPEPDLKALIQQSYHTFRHEEVTPTVQVGNLFILELFHGPTLAFKDVALQFLGNLFEYILHQRGGRLNILGATSGDTGSAAIHGVRGKDNINIFVMHPRGRTSPLQALQMTSVLDNNVYNLEVEGTFDDCQHIMKTIFSDVSFKDQFQLGAVNSVNWARVLAQTVYYFYSALRVMTQTGAASVQFSVPTGNFGDILAGYLAWKMGLPVHTLILATNENDILCRFFRDGDYSVSQVHPTISPSMDIQVASNFERYLYFRVGEDSSRLRAMMETFAQTRSLQVEPDANGSIDSIFKAGRGDTTSTLEVIRRYSLEKGYVFDPHTAVGVFVAEQQCEANMPVICLATAHPAKFPEAIQEACAQSVTHEILETLKGSQTRCVTIPNSVERVKSYVRQQVSKV